MQRQILGQTGLEVSWLGLGGHLFPSYPVTYYPGFYGRRFMEHEAESIRRDVIETALNHGINLLAADFDFEARALGRILRDLHVRDQVIITSVIDFQPDPDRAFAWTELEAKIDLLLTNLRTDRLELPQIRVSDRLLSSGLLEDLVGAFAIMKAKGKIVAPIYYSGDNDLQVLSIGLQRGWFPVVMKAFGLLNPRPLEILMPEVIRANAGFIGIVPFQKGWLFDCGREAGLSPAHTARLGLRWLADQPGVSSILFGVAGSEEIRENVQAVSQQLSDRHFQQGLARLTRTSTYQRFLDQVERLAPHLAFDWRDIEAAACAD